MRGPAEPHPNSYVSCRMNMLLSILPRCVPAHCMSDRSVTRVHPTQAARDQQLRRLCERKPSGKLHAPLKIHQQWLRGGTDREELFDLLKSVDYDKAFVVSIVCVTLVQTTFTSYANCSHDGHVRIFRQAKFKATVTKTKEQLNRASRRKRRQWHTKESMAKKLGWSKCLNRTPCTCFVWPADMLLL